MTLIMHYLIDEKRSDEPMTHHANCSQTLPEQVKKNKTYLKRSFIRKQSDLNKLKLPGEPKLVKLSDNFREKVIPVLYAHYCKQMAHYASLDPNEREPSCVAGTDIFIDKLFSSLHIGKPDSVEDDDEDPIPSMEDYFEEIDNHDIKELERSCFETAYKSLIMDLQREANWENDWDTVNTMLTTLATLMLCPQAAHSDYPKLSDILLQYQLSFIFAYSQAGTYLTVWSDDPYNPILIRIPYGYGILFNRKLVHAGGIGKSNCPDTVYSKPDIGFPRGHIYVVKDNSNFPYNFVCYEDSNRYVSGTTEAYNDAIDFLKDKKLVEERKKVEYGDYPGPKK